jgi:adenosylhomocysteine nucleosidase
VVIGEAYHEYDRKLRKDEKNPAIRGDLETLESIKCQFPALKVGKIISGDQLLDDKRIRDELYERYRALALDMDSAIMAKVATANNCNFLALKAILDKADDKTCDDFNQNFEEYSHIPAKILNEYLKNHFIAW